MGNDKRYKNRVKAIAGCTPISPTTQATGSRADDSSAGSGMFMSVHHLIVATGVVGWFFIL